MLPKIQRWFVSKSVRAAALAIPLDSTGELKADNQVNWRYAKGTPYVPSPLLWDHRLYFTQANNAILTILDIKTGKALLDGERLPLVSPTP